MKYPTIFLTGLLVLASAPTPSEAGWGGGTCSVPMAAVAAVTPQPPEYEWRVGQAGDQLHLLRLGLQVGTYRADDGQFYPYDGQSWGNPVEAPFPVPMSWRKPQAKPQARPQVGDLPTGCDQSRIKPKDTVSVGGKPVPAEDFFAVPPDDSGKPYICVIGDDQVLTTAKTRFAPGGTYNRFTNDFVIGYFNPGDWQVAKVGLTRPGISILAPRGRDGRSKELHHQDDLDGLDKAITALRDPAPNYDPSKTPDLRQDPSPLVPSTPAESTGLCAIVCLILGWISTKFKVR